MNTQPRDPAPCLHPQARHQHGTRATYVQDKCRCAPCTQANRVYEERRSRLAMMARPVLVDAAPVRAHVRALMAAGIGHKQIARLAGVGRGAVAALLYGNPCGGRSPSRRIRPQTAAALLALSPPHEAAPAAVRVPPAAPRYPRPARAYSSRIPLVDPDADWRASALCAQSDPDLWFPDKGSNASVLARAICARCPVSEPCAKDADGIGVWGGKSPTQRRRAAS